MDQTVEEWLAGTNYPDWRKQEILREWDRSDFGVRLRQTLFRMREARVGGFVKAEWYPEYKHLRGIHARPDIFKAVFGPVFKHIEHEVFSLPWFVKKIPVSERARVVGERFFGKWDLYASTDFTAFESLFDVKFMRAVERPLYFHMTRNLPNHQEWMDMYDEIICSKNVIDYQNFRMNVMGLRMSGEMNTSLGNGWSNYCIMSYVAAASGIKFDGMFEGDDGILGLRGKLREDLFSKLGLKVKLQYHSDLSTASFCGLIFDPEDCVIITEPKRVLATFGWAGAQYACAATSKLRQLLRAKSLSLAYCYSGCPIIQSLAHYGLRVTEGMSIDAVIQSERNMWVRQQYMDAQRFGHTRRPVPQRTRDLMERVYGVTVQTQLEVEAYLDGRVGFDPLELPSIDFPELWIQNSLSYVLVSVRQQPDAFFDLPEFESECEIGLRPFNSS